MVRSAGGVHVSYDGSTMSEPLQAAGSVRNQGTAEAGGRVLLHQGSTLDPDSTPRLVEMRVPGLIACCRVGLDEPRAVRISKNEWMRHYEHLSLRRIAQATVYTLMALDMSARHQVMAKGQLFCRLRSAEQSAAISSVTAQKLSILRHYDSACLRTARDTFHGRQCHRTSNTPRFSPTGSEPWRRTANDQSGSAGTSPPRLFAAVAGWQCQFVFYPQPKEKWATDGGLLGGAGGTPCHVQIRVWARRIHCGVVP